MKSLMTQRKQGVVDNNLAMNDKYILYITYLYMQYMKYIIYYSFV